MKYLIAFLTIPVLVGLMGLSYAAFPPMEDDRFWNCHLSGDNKCGPSISTVGSHPAAPWHGFPNLFWNEGK